MKTQFQLVVLCLFVVELVLSFPQNWGDPNAVVETIKLDVYEVPPIPSVVAFDFDAARKGKTADIDSKSLDGGAKDSKGGEKKEEGAKETAKPEEKKEEKKEEKPAA